MAVPLSAVKSPARISGSAVATDAGLVLVHGRGRGGSGSTSEFSACFEITNAIFADGFELGNPSAWTVTVP